MVTLSWKDRRCQFINTAESHVFQAVVTRILTLIGAEEVLQNILDRK